MAKTTIKTYVSALLSMWCQRDLLKLSAALWGFERITGTTKEKCHCQILQTIQRTVSRFLCWLKQLQNSLFTSYWHTIPSPICVRAQGRDGQKRGKRKRSVVAQKAFEVLDCSEKIGDKARVVANRNLCKR